MKYFIVLSLMIFANAGFSKSLINEKNSQKSSRAPASEDGAAPALVITMDKETYQALHPNDFVPDCEAGTRLFSDGSCRANPYADVTPSSDWDKWLDTRKSEYCYHVKDVSSRVYDSNIALSTAQKAFDKWEDSLYDNMQAAHSDHLGAPRFRSCEDCNVCGQRSDDGSGTSVSVSRNVIKSFESDKHRPPNIPKPPKAPGFTVKFRF
jgi:hypothetical protein